MFSTKLRTWYTLNL